jgi:hypothetical protein
MLCYNGRHFLKAMTRGVNWESPRQAERSSHTVLFCVDFLQILDNIRVSEESEKYYSKETCFLLVNLACPRCV